MLLFVYPLTAFLWRYFSKKIEERINDRISLNLVRSIIN